MRVHALVVTALVAGGCQFGGDAAGDNYRCGNGEACPGGQTCVDGWCRSAGPADASAIDAAGTDDGLVAWYRMESLSAEGALRDEAGEHHGRCDIEQCPTRTAGKLEEALEFDGIDDHIRIPDEADFRLASGTATAWVYYTGSLTGAVVGKPYGPTDGDAWLMFVDPEADGGAGVGLEIAGGNSLRSGAAFELNRWAHLAVTWSETAKRIYVNGEMVADEPVTTTIDYDSHEVLIGTDKDADALVIPFAGAIDEVRVYRRELSAVEIAAEAASS